MKHRRLLSWVSLAVLVALTGVLGVLQYRWIGEVSQMERKKLQDYLQSTLNEVSRDFNSELNGGLRALLPSDSEVAQLGREQAYEKRYSQWKSASANARLFDRVGVAWEQNSRPVLRILNFDSGLLAAADWPPEWSRVEESVTEHRPMRPMDDSALVDIPRFVAPQEETDWLIAEVDRGYVANTLAPELLARHFGNNYQSEYQVELNTARGRPSDKADASVTLFDVMPQMPDRRGRGPGGPGRPGHAGGARPDGPHGFGPGPPGPPPGRWQLSLTLKAGSLEAVVARVRARNLAISGAILLLMLASAVTLVRVTRRAQRLAEMEMEFVAGVSHELGTPLSVIRTAAFNLRGKMSTNASQVETYGALIQEQSERLAAIVEQVLRFAGARAGQLIREREPIPVDSLIEGSLESSRRLLEETQCALEKKVEPGLPLITGDAVALRHALENLISNAVKYGRAGGNWIGISARTSAGLRGTMVEIGVSDHGPGIPAEERKHIFDAFFRGKRAVQDQIHGTGLGLNLVKKIVEAHGGTIDVESNAGVGTTFIVRLPIRQGEQRDELAHSLG